MLGGAGSGAGLWGGPDPWDRVSVPYQSGVQPRMVLATATGLRPPSEVLVIWINRRHPCFQLLNCGEIC